MLDDGIFLLVFEREQRQLAIGARVIPVGEQPLLRTLAGREHDVRAAVVLTVIGKQHVALHLFSVRAEDRERSVFKHVLVLLFGVCPHHSISRAILPLRFPMPAWSPNCRPDEQLKCDYSPLCPLFLENLVKISKKITIFTQRNVDYCSFWWYHVCKDHKKQVGGIGEWKKKL